jgi:DedD protein
MGLLSIFKRRADTSNGASASGPAPDDVQRARTRARQRLIGAVVLVGIGIVGFPLVFETQPRPIPVDIPIEVPRKDGAPSLVMPAARTSGSNSSASAVQVQPAPATSTTAPLAAPNDVVTETPEEAAPPTARAASKPIAKSAEVSKPVVEAKTAPESKPTAAEAKPAAIATDSARAKSLLEGKPPAAGAESGRYVVQVGAFADANAARETRLKAEKLGIKTYTQVVSTSAGSRIRVRLGPFGNRDEADSAMTKARGAGLTAVVLTL